MQEIVGWLESEVFNDWSIAYEFHHVLHLGEIPLPDEVIGTGDIALLLQSLGTEYGDLHVTVERAFRQFHPCRGISRVRVGQTLTANR